MIDTINVEKIIEAGVPDNVLIFAKDREDVRIPSKRDEDACYDIYANFEQDHMVIAPHETVMIPTGLRCAFSEKWKLQLHERGSTGTKGMGQRSGQIDSGFRGEIFVPITNHNTKPLIIAKDNVVITDLLQEVAIIYPYNKAICQASLVEVPAVEVAEINAKDLLKIPSKRGTGQIGSSGK